MFLNRWKAKEGGQLRRKVTGLAHFSAEELRATANKLALRLVSATFLAFPALSLRRLCLLASRLLAALLLLLTAPSAAVERDDLYSDEPFSSHSSLQPRPSTVQACKETAGSGPWVTQQRPALNVIFLRQSRKEKRIMQGLGHVLLEGVEVGRRVCVACGHFGCTLTPLSPNSHSSTPCRQCL